MDDKTDNEVQGRPVTHITYTQKGVDLGYAFMAWGGCAAMILSHDTNRSGGWMVLHGILSWVYVIYHGIAY